MSRIGKNPVKVPSDVQVDIQGLTVKVKGKKGELTLPIAKDVKVLKADGSITVEPTNQTAQAKRMWATTQRMLNAMVVGVSKGYEKKLEITGVGYRCAMQGKDLVLQLGFSHEVKFPVPQGIQIAVEKQTAITITGFDKQLVGQVAANIRGLKKPEPYKGKGIKYEGERILRKEGKKK